MGQLAGDIVEAPGAPALDVITASGTWTNPGGLRHVIVELVGGGGGSGGCAATGASQVAASPGAGAGGYARKLILAEDLGATETVTIGAGGTAGASGANDGGSGGTTSFGSHVSATGGTFSGGGAAQSTQGPLGVGGPGGTGSGGDINIQGSRGFYATCFYGAVARAPGGASQLSSTEPGGTSSTGLAGAAGENYGGGAHGCANGQSQSAKAGSTGAPGVVIVTSVF